MPQGPGTYDRPGRPKKGMGGLRVMPKMPGGGRLYDYMKAGGKLPMVKNDKGEMVPFYAADDKGKMEYGGKTMGHGGMNDGEPMLTIKIGEDGMKYGEKGKKVKKQEGSDPGDRPKGEIYFDADAAGFFQVQQGQQGTYSARVKSPRVIYDYIEENAGKEGVGLAVDGIDEETLMKYVGLRGYKTNFTGEPIGRDGSIISEDELAEKGIFMDTSGMNKAAGRRSEVMHIIETALNTGDAGLMGLVLNPYADKTKNVISGVTPYGIDRVENTQNTKDPETGEVTKRGVTFRSQEFQDGYRDEKTGDYIRGGGKTYEPSKIVSGQVFAEDPTKTGQTITTPEGETIQVKPDAVQTPGFGEGTSNPGPDAPPRTREEGAVPYQMNLGGRLRMANQGAKMAEQARRTVFRFPRS